MQTIWENCRYAELDAGGGFLGRLWHGTMQSLLDRTRADGFCETSFGEEHGVRCYGECHYSRDASEAAWVLADQGCLEPAVKILEFTLLNIPADQYHIVHAYRPDATPLHNKIQIDTPAHPARALAMALARGADGAVLDTIFDRLDRVIDDTFRRHWHAEHLLLDSGNYNEQLGGSEEPLLDMFTNGAMFSGCHSMADAALRLGRAESLARKYRRRADALEQGIEQFLYDPETDLYRAALPVDGRAMAERPFNWISLYAERWYPGRRSAWRNACDRLWQEGCNRWGDLLIPSGETGFMKLRTMGKVIGQLLRFSARERQDERLGRLLAFLESTIRRPADIFPEYWLHHMPEPGESPYLDWFFAEFKGVWEGYVENPSGDYTVDSGNCEQCAVFLSCFANDVFGFSGDWRQVEVAPRLPGQNGGEMRSRALGVRDGREVRGSFRLGPESLTFESDAPVEQLDLVLPFAAPHVVCEPASESIEYGENAVRARFRGVSGASIRISSASPDSGAAGAAAGR